MQKAENKFTDEQKQIAINLFNQGCTLNEIGDALKVPRRTVGKLLKHLGLKRSHKEAAQLKISSPLDDPKIIEDIKVLRSTHNLSEIAKHFNSSISAVQRICKKYNIVLPNNHNEVKALKIRESWTVEKRKLASYRSTKLITAEIRQKLSKSSKRLWQNDGYKKLQAINRSNQSWAVSSLQKILYDILDDLGVKYYREHQDKPNDPETVIGPYNFDCVIPRENKPTLLIECHGDYWHSLDKAVTKDRQKQSYIVNNFSGQYELKCIWEHEFKCVNKVTELLKYWLGITETQIIDYKFDDLVIRDINVKTANELLDKYHYLSGCGRGGIIYGSFLQDKLISVCAFSTLVRYNLPYDKDTTRELSRFCIHPNYQKKNFGTWMISRSMKLLPKHIKTIVSYCDTTYNHDGSMYKAANFKFDGFVKPDYWYVNENKWVMHKKSLYDHAKKMSMTENEYAKINGYKRVYGTEKLRFIYTLR